MRHLCGERGSPAAGNGMVCLWHWFVDWWPRQCQRHLHKGEVCRMGEGDVQLTLRALQ